MRGQALPDGVFGALPVHLSILIQDDVHLQVAIVVMGREVVGHHPGRNPQAAQD